MKKHLIFFLFMFSFSFAFGQNPNLGSSGAQFLEIPVGARAASMGSAFVGLTDDASSAFWNPSGLTNIRNNAAHFSYMDWFGMFDFNAAALSFKMEDVGTFAASLIVFSMDETEVTTEFEPNGTGRFFDAQDVALGLSYARNLTDKFAVGITLKYVQQRIWNETANGFAFDVGTQYKLDFQNMTIAMKMSNFGPDLQFGGEDLLVTYDKSSSVPKNRLTKARLDTDTYPLPLCFQVGVAIDLFSSEIVDVRADIDAVHPNDNTERVNLGTEISVFDRIFLRGGYKYNYDDEGATFGAGANIPFAGTKVSFNYAYSVYDILPSIHRISIDLDF